MPDGVRYLGSRPAACPSRLLADPVLEPVDKIVWLLIREAVRETGAPAAFPTYASLGQRANVASSATIARAVAILRATRWLTLTERARDAGGRFQGNVYVLADAPLPLAHAQELDPHYAGFLREASSHRHARVRTVAARMLAALEAEEREGPDAGVAEHRVSRSGEALFAVEGGPARRYFRFSARNGRRLQNRRLTTDTNKDPVSEPEHRLHILHPQNVKTVPLKSCCYIKTTTTVPKSPQKSKPVRDGPALVFPARFTPEQREAAERTLAVLPEAQRQPVLDELEGRLRAAGKGMAPVYDVLRYLQGLCAQVQAGTFELNQGLNVQAERARRRQAQARASQPDKRAGDAARRELDPASKEVRVAGVAAMRRVLGRCAENSSSPALG